MKAGRGVLVGVAAGLAALLLLHLQVLRPLEWKSWDARLRLLARPSAADADIVLVLIDQASLDVYEKEMALPWPWPRQMYSALLRFLRAGGARAVAFDLVFSEGSYFGVEDDADLARAMAGSGNVFCAFYLSDEEGASEPPGPGLLDRFALAGADAPPQAVHALKSAALPVDALLAAAAGAGNVRFLPDADQIYRRVPLAFSVGGRVLPSLPLAISRRLSGGPDLDAVPLDRSGQLVLRYRGPSGTYAAYSIGALINSQAQIEAGGRPQVDPALFADKVVLVGASAPGLLDLRPTPFATVTPGVELHATVLDNLLRREYAREAGTVPTWAFVMALALATALGVSLVRKVWGQALVFGCAAAVPAGAAVLAFRRGVWLDFVAPELAVLLGFVGAALLNYSVEGRRRRFLKSAFRHYLSPEVIERVLVDPSLLRLGGEKREITSFFSDLAGFTSVAEGLEPEALVALLNDYLTEMTDIILAAGGTLDKYVGDAIVAFWNAPLDQPDHAGRACRAALSCLRRLEELGPVFRGRYGRTVAMRIGLNSGPAVVGNMGSGRRFDYTAMGDTVNLASRLEGACKQYGVGLLVGEETRRLVRDELDAREVDLIRVVGKARPVRVYELLGERGGRSGEEIAREASYQAALEAYRNRDWDGAAALFAALAEAGDPVAGVYARRTTGLRADPPPVDWDGVYELKIK
ncbi:MAG: adenylate/guanylate cyclase domain-containing protein [Candidatus Aminicenantes bacterium]|nr:adenylate/guanylate cyclase domain-containing protein [Candidatus Aminicenantes bacterium]